MSETNDAPSTIADDQAAQLSTRRSADGELAELRYLLRVFDEKMEAAKRKRSDVFPLVVRLSYDVRTDCYRFAADIVRDAINRLEASGAPLVGTSGDDIR